ncbi:hypothetical protein HYW99_04465 [Candidatus Woesearchaeota archaeon]|nr:hypothetical protein [Candidatus Woesearchaeota archaeon]
MVNKDENMERIILPNGFPRFDEEIQSKLEEVVQKSSYNPRQVAEKREISSDGWLLWSGMKTLNILKVFQEWYLAFQKGNIDEIQKLSRKRQYGNTLTTNWGAYVKKFGDIWLFSDETSFKYIKEMGGTIFMDALFIEQSFQHYISSRLHHVGSKLDEIGLEIIQEMVDEGGTIKPNAIVESERFREDEVTTIFRGNDLKDLVVVYGYILDRKELRNVIFRNNSIYHQKELDKRDRIILFLKEGENLIAQGFYVVNSVYEQHNLPHFEASSTGKTFRRFE